MDRNKALEVQRHFLNGLYRCLCSANITSSVAFTSRLFWEMGCRLYERHDRYDSARYFFDGTRFVSRNVRNQFPNGVSQDATEKYITGLLAGQPDSRSSLYVYFDIADETPIGTVVSCIASMACELVTVLPFDEAREALDDNWGILAARINEARTTTERIHIECDHSWDDLAKISREITRLQEDALIRRFLNQQGLLSNDGLLIDCRKSVQLLDGQDASVRILDYAHDTLPNDEKAGLSFAFTKPVGVMCMNPTLTNSGGWEQSHLRAWLNFEFMRKLPRDIASHITGVCKRTNNTGFTTSHQSVTVTVDRLWLFSFTELYGSWNAKDVWLESPEAPLYDLIANTEGSQYRLFEQLGVSDPYGVKDPSPSRALPLVVQNENGMGVNYWLRSPDPDTHTRFGFINPAGEVSNGVGATNQYAVVPGFCF